MTGYASSGAIPAAVAVGVFICRSVVSEKGVVDFEEDGILGWGWGPSTEGC